MVLDLSKPVVMGILNVTPDSFSDGGQFTARSAALSRVEQMLNEGAEIIDVGGESTRPGAAPVSESEEIERVIPLIELIRNQFDVTISVDTSKAGVINAAIEAGASMINDVRALTEEGALQAAVAANVPVCLMHMQGQPTTMQETPSYKDVVSEVADFLEERAQVCVRSGIPRDNIILDPGFGFGKTLRHNLILLHALSFLVKKGFPVLVGMSRKSMIGSVLDKPVNQRLAGGLAAATLAVWQGASIIRTHDVAETVDAVRFSYAVMQAELSE